MTKLFISEEQRNNKFIYNRSGKLLNMLTSCLKTDSVNAEEKNLPITKNSARINLIGIGKPGVC